MSKLTVEELAEDLKALTERIREMEANRAEDARKHLEIIAGDHAMGETILQFTQELAARVGFSVEQFVARFEAASDWHRDRFLQNVECVDPQLAAVIDHRSLESIPTEDHPPCILPC